MCRGWAIGWDKPGRWWTIAGEATPVCVWGGAYAVMQNSPMRHSGCIIQRAPGSRIPRRDPSLGFLLKYIPVVTWSDAWLRRPVPASNPVDRGILSSEPLRRDRYFRSFVDCVSTGEYSIRAWLDFFFYATVKFTLSSFFYFLRLFSPKRSECFFFFFFLLIKQKRFPGEKHY